jgi:hypothetical protein
MEDWVVGREEVLEAREGATKFGRGAREGMEEDVEAGLESFIAEGRGAAALLTAEIGRTAEVAASFFCVVVASAGGWFADPLRLFPSPLKNFPPWVRPRLFFSFSFSLSSPPSPRVEELRWEESFGMEEDLGIDDDGAAAVELGSLVPEVEVADEVELLCGWETSRRIFSTPEWRKPKRCDAPPLAGTTA